MDYVGEHLMPGKLGQFFVVLSFAGSLVATISYFKTSSFKIHRRNGLLEKDGAVCISPECRFSLHRFWYHILYYPPALLRIQLCLGTFQQKSGSQIHA